MLKLDWNEATVAPSPLVKQRIEELLQQPDFFHLYPVTHNEKLLQLIANYVGLPEENVQYFITDANGDGSQFQPVIFSTTEREIGVWTNGKPLYEKTIITNSSVTNADVDVDISNLNVDIIIYIGGEYSRKVNNLELYYPWGENEYNTGDEIVFGSYCRFYKTNDSITYKIIHKDNSTTDYQRFTIRYT